eukprot:SAG22_NODE_2685_length_2311_cov_3.259042_2_plen_137_part_00
MDFPLGHAAAKIAALELQLVQRDSGEDISTNPLGPGGSSAYGGDGGTGGTGGGVPEPGAEEQQVSSKALSSLVLPLEPSCCQDGALPCRLSVWLAGWLALMDAAPPVLRHDGDRRRNRRRPAADGLGQGRRRAGEL